MAERLEEFYDRYIASSVALAYLLTGDRFEAEDIAHEAIARLLGRLQHIRRADQFQSYLRRTIVNLHLSRLRRLRVQRRHERHAWADAEIAESPRDVALERDIWTALQRVPLRQRSALVLRYFEDLTERETAEILRCSVPAVKALTTRGLQSMRTELVSKGGHLDGTRA